ncbi:MAG: Rieske 2Fe-2S domain-containing protein [Actinobacteria bacterium]|nr:Rieske 2Fe-2S domain-containing protein [Actinomycetota bacterium]
MTRLRAALRGIAVLAALRSLARLLPERRRASSETAQRDPGAERLAAAALLASAAGSGGFVVAYVLDAGPQLLGVGLVVALGGIALALATWALRLVPREVVAEPREPMEPPPQEREPAAQTLGQPLARRGFLVRLLGLALGGLGLAALVPVASLGPAPGGALRRTAWRAGARVVTPQGMPVGLDALPVGGSLTVFPEGATDEVDSQVVLIRLAPEDLREQPGHEDATVAGYVAFSQICTHAGCPVGLYEQASKRLLCPCHQSVFDVRQGAKPVGGPAIRALPQLPLAVDDDGTLVARGDFPDPPGAATWELLA